MKDENDMFINDIFDKIEPPHSTKFSLAGVQLPTNQDIYFISKWHELHDKYAMARMFLRKTQESNYDYWFKPVGDLSIQKGVELTFQAELFETALIYYNILVDLSWTWTYVSAEYVLYSFDKEGNITNVADVCGMHPIEEAYELLRKTENGVSTPHAEGNPFSYLKKMRPEFTEAVDIVVNFWKEFSNSEIRSLYNYIKHKGKPLYKEIEDIRGGKIWSLNMEGKEYPTDIREVQKILNLNEYIQKLIEFDDNKLYPYVYELLKSLKQAVNPSPMLF